MYGEEQRERGDGLLPAGEVGHGLEALARRHAVVVDAVQVRLLRVLRAQERLRRLVHRQRLTTIDVLDNIQYSNSLSLSRIMQVHAVVETVPQSSSVSSRHFSINIPGDELVHHIAIAFAIRTRSLLSPH